MRKEVEGEIKIGSWYVVAVFPYRSALVKGVICELQGVMEEEALRVLSESSVLDNHIVVELVDVNVGESFYLGWSDLRMVLGVGVTEVDW